MRATYAACFKAHTCIYRLYKPSIRAHHAKVLHNVGTKLNFKSHSLPSPLLYTGEREVFFLAPRIGCVCFIPVNTRQRTAAMV